MNHSASVRLYCAWFRTLGVTALLTGSPLAFAQTVDSSSTASWAQGAIEHAQKMRQFDDGDDHSASQDTPPVIPTFQLTLDPLGVLGNFQPGGRTRTADNAFFQSLGVNGRTCFSCHQPQNGWTISTRGVRERFHSTGGSDPIFRLIDGATCPTDDVSTPRAKEAAFGLLLQKGVIRIGMPLPAAGTLQFEVTSVDDPYNCNTNPAVGLTSNTTGVMSVYRRPLPSTNLGFIGGIMWDEREPTLLTQAFNATLIHAQATVAPTPDQVQQMADFESGIFTAQLFDNIAGSLTANGATGGPVVLSAQLANFTVGENNPAPLPGTHVINPNFNPNIFNLYTSWASVTDSDPVRAARKESVARGQIVFNTTKFIMSRVRGINDDSGVPAVPAVCGNCHNTPDVGTHSLTGPTDIGIVDSDEVAATAPTLDKTGLPVFTLTCTSGPLAGTVYVVSDPGRALISGQCKDIGRFKIPSLRGLASRAPYFHDGSARTLLDVVNFYDKRFSIGFTDQQKIDLVNFLETL